MTPIVLRFPEHPTFEVAVEMLTAASAELDRGSERRVLILDCLHTKDYPTASRDYFVDWARKHRHRISAVGVVTRNRLWDMVMRAVSFSSGCQILPFSTLEQALRWAGVDPASLPPTGETRRLLTG